MEKKTNKKTESTIKTTKKKTIKEEKQPKIEVIDTSDLEREEEKKTLLKSHLKDIILVIGLIIVVIIGCFTLKGEKEEVTYTLPLELTGDAGLHELSYTEYKEKVDNNESFVFIIESASCSHCQNFMPVAEEFANSNNLPIYYIDTTTLESDEWNSFEKSNTFFKKSNGDWGTPTTIVLAGKYAVDYIVGETDADSLLELYEKYFEINK